MSEEEINNAFYDHYGTRWYTAYDDPVALLRAENRIKLPWIINRLQSLSSNSLKVLDVGCGGGFLSNELAKFGHNVTGVDISPESLNVAREHDVTKTVDYQLADAFHLPFGDKTFDVVTAMDFLEHVDRPDEVIKEFSRVLKPGGVFFFHTFNRNFLSHLVAIKLVEWFIKNTPKNMHIIKLFIKPKEIRKYCKNAGMKFITMTGIMPRVLSIDMKMIKTGIVSPNMEFRLSKSTILSYLGFAIKETSIS